MGCSFSISAWGLVKGWSLVWLGRAPLPSSEIPLMVRCSELLFTPFSSGLGKGMLLLNSTLGIGFIFLWDVKGPRLSAGVRKRWWVGGWAGAWRNMRLGVRFLMIPAGYIPAKEEADSELKKLSPHL